MCKIRGLDAPQLISSSKPKYSQDLCKKYDIPFITKFADKYLSFMATRNGKNDVRTNEAFVVVFANKVDVYNLIACAAIYYEHFLGKIDNSAKHPHFNIMPAFTVSEALRSHYKDDILPDCNYRIFSLTELYPIIGSKNMPFKLTYNYKVHPFQETHNGKEYVKIFDDDPIVKLLNALPGELITCNALSYDDAIFSQTLIRQVEEKQTNIHKIAPSGVCIRYKEPSAQD